GSEIAEHKALQMTLASAGRDRSPGAHCDAGVGLDRLDEVVRHVGVEGAGSDEDGDASCVASKVERRLAGGVAAADGVARGSRQPMCLGCGPTVEDTGSAQFLELRNSDAFVARPNRQDNSLRADRATVVERQAELVSGTVQRGGAMHKEEVRAEHGRLVVCL